ncbi:MAG: hypothetical protein PWQ49_84 [Methanohalophilus sp.]|nr:hypothetical protein [Methanohalophilus sp.]
MISCWILHVSPKANMMSKRTFPIYQVGTEVVLILLKDVDFKIFKMS